MNTTYITRDGPSLYKRLSTLSYGSVFLLVNQTTNTVKCPTEHWMKCSLSAGDAALLKRDGKTRSIVRLSDGLILSCPHNDLVLPIEAELAVIKQEPNSETEI